MKKSLLVSFILAASLVASEINVAVAANVSYAIDELKAEFAKTNPSTSVRITLGSSGKLTAQIKNGAPYGIFVSANMKYPNALYEEGIATTKPIIYAQGALAYLSQKPRDFSQGIKILQNPKIVKIAIANPKTAPYGKATVEALKNAGVYDSIKSKLVYGESISQTLSYTLNATEIGIIAKSSLYSSKMSRFKKDSNWASIDAKLYKPINQGIVLLRFSKNSQEYRAFYEFVLSPKAREIFKRYGYLVQ